MGSSENTSRARIDPDAEDRMILLRRELGVSSFGINQLNLRPGQRGRIHVHADQEEVYLVLTGELTIGIEGEEQTLGEGELIRVAPHVRRQISNRGSELLQMIALGGAGEHVSRDATAYESWEAEEGASPQEVPLPEDLDV